MSLTRLTNAMEQAQQQPRKQVTITDLISQQANEIAKALPGAAKLTPDRLGRIALTLIKSNSRLAGCSGQSLLGALMTAAQLGLEPGPMGHCYFVPRWNNKASADECTFQVGYKGLIELGRRAGVNVKARTVYTGDTFKLTYGYHDEILHEPCTEDDKRGDVRGYYMTATWEGGEFALYMTPNDIERIRLRSDSGKKNEGPWRTDYDAMARKTVIRAAFNSGQVPMSTEIARAINADETVRTKLTEDALDEEPPADTWTTPSNVPAIETASPSHDAPDAVLEGEVVEHEDPVEASPLPDVEEQPTPDVAHAPVGVPPSPPAGTDTLSWLRSKPLSEIRDICSAYDIAWPRTKIDRDLAPVAELIDQANA